MLYLEMPHPFQRDQIVQVGLLINEECHKQIDEVTGKVRGQLRPLSDYLHAVWGIGQKLQQLKRSCGELDQLLTQIAQERSLVLTSLSAVSVLSRWLCS